MPAGEIDDDEYLQRLRVLDSTRAASHLTDRVDGQVVPCAWLRAEFGLPVGYTNSR